MARRSAGCPRRFHKAGSRVVIYSRNGHDFTERFLSIAQVLHELPAKRGSTRWRGRSQRCRRPAELRQAARALDKAEHNPPVGV